MQPLDSKPINLTAGKGTSEKKASKRRFPKVLKLYILLLLIVTIAAAIVFGVFMILVQKRFFRVEASSILCYHTEKCHEMIPGLSIHEVFQIIRTDAVKQQAGDIVAIPQDKQKYLKEALDISYESVSDSTNLLKVSVRWDEADQARQLVEGDIQAAIMDYVRFRTNYLREIITELNKTKSEYEHEKTNIEEKLSKLAQSVHGENVKQNLENLRMHESKLEDELLDSQKQYTLATVQHENLKNNIPTQYDYSKIKIASRHPYLLDILKKRNDALENYEIQKALGTENDRQVKEAQIKYRFAEDQLSKTLENLNLTEEEVISLNTTILKQTEELEAVQITMDGLKKHIEDIQYQQSQKQKEITEVSGLLPQEEELNKIHNIALARLDKIENEIMDLNRCGIAVKKALVP